MATQRYEAVPELVNIDIAQPYSVQTFPRKPIFNSSNTHITTQEYASQTGTRLNNDQDVVLAEKSTPPEAKVLRDRVYQVILRALIDVLLASLPCLFMSLGIIAARLHSQPTSSYGANVEQAARLGPTIFPIAFAAIVARFNKHLAR